MSRRAVRIETFEQRIEREALEAFRAEERKNAKRNSTTQRRQLQRAPARKYSAPELESYAGRPGAMRAFDLPSRINNRLYFRDGRVTDLQGQPIGA